MQRGADERSNRSRRAGSENSTAVAVEAANISVAVEAAIQRLQWRQRFSGCSGGNEERNAEGRKEEKNFRQYIRKLVGGLYPK